ncbi:MAG TPA: hypothetical protein VJ957_12405, partial [Longimicrobiales bacterium]|nr:hypothetical protein [Longimicrobiales bacterium]
MRIGLDVSCLRYGVASGTAVYAYSLARALLDVEAVAGLVLYFGARESRAAHAVLQDLESRGAHALRGPAPWRWSPDGGWWLPQPAGRALFRTIDVFHAGESFFPRRVPVPAVATVHDLTTLLF